jgi:hypothetical protein
MGREHNGIGAARKGGKLCDSEAGPGEAGFIPGERRHSFKRPVSSSVIIKK